MVRPAPLPRASRHANLAPSGAYPLYDFLAREYNPSWGRWLSPDPMGGNVLNPQSLNRYAYALNNPTTFTDPLGLDSSNPADPCSGTGWESDATCAGPTDQCPPGDIECQLYYLNGPWDIAGGGSGGGGGGGGGSTSSAPPAGQPPLVGGSAGQGFISGTVVQGPIVLPWPWIYRITAWGLPEIAGAVEGIGVAASAWPSILLYALLQRGDGAVPAIHQAKGGKGNVADTGVVQQAQELMRQNPGITVCQALQILMDAARSNPAQQQKIKATQKQYGCRRHN
jgi:RHS repeat-associated protein